MTPPPQRRAKEPRCRVHGTTLVFFGWDSKPDTEILGCWITGCKTRRTRKLQVE